MSLDDELRRRLQEAADRAGAGTSPAAITQQVAKQTAVGARPPLRLLGAIGAAGLVAGGALGFTALKPADESTGVSTRIEVQQYSLYDCPDGAAAGIAYPGDRVYVTGRNEAGDWLEVRDPRQQTTSRWVPADAVDPDAVADVPVRSCSEPVTMIVEGATTTVAETTTTTTTTVPATLPATVPPTPPPTPAPAPDTQKPSVGQGTRTPDLIHDASYGPGGCPISSALTVVATDNVGVTKVTATWTKSLAGSPLAFTKGASNTWTATFGPFAGLDASYPKDIVISIVANDAAGNTSTATTLTVRVDGMDCLI